MSPELSGVDYFAQLSSEVAHSNGVPAWLAQRRREAWDAFAAVGFPTTRDEAWRFTSVSAIARAPFCRPGRMEVRSASAELAEWLRFGARCALVFVNGHYDARLSCPWPSGGVRVVPLTAALADADLSRRIETQLGRVQEGPATPFASLNMALVEDGACVVIEPGTMVADPISLVFISTGAGGHPPVASPRVLVLAGRGSQATLVEGYGGEPETPYLLNGVTEIVLEDGAIVDHVRIQRESATAFHVGSVAVRQGRDSRYRSIALDLGASLARTDIDVVLAGEGSECELDGLFMVDGARHTDSHTRIDHASPHTTSREVYRGILEDRSRGVFYGRIIVRPGAQKIDAYQLNKNLVLSTEALVNSTPQLEIRADDVRCRHASTTGQIDPAALFYLRSRGLGEEQARGLLTFAFAGDIVARVAVPRVRQAVQDLLRQRLPGAPQEAM